MKKSIAGFIAGCTLLVVAASCGSQNKMENGDNTTDTTQNMELNNNDPLMHDSIQNQLTDSAQLYPDTIQR